MKTSIYTISHKKFKCPDIEGYIPLQVGLSEDLNYVRDNSGDNISDKNKNYCELTGLYWIWKNDKNSDIVGISHYRRYFTTQKIFKNSDKILDCEQIEKILNNYDVIIPKKEYYRETVKEQYCLYSGFEKDLNIIENILKNKYPEYLEYYNRIMNRNYISQYNMIICKKDIYDDYCKWLFDILFEAEKHINLEDGYTDYQKRIYGFISERLLNVWVEKNNLKVKNVRVINVENTLKSDVIQWLRRIRNILHYDLKKIF